MAEFAGNGKGLKKTTIILMIPEMIAVAKRFLAEVKPERAGMGKLFIGCRLTERNEPGIAAAVTGKLLQKLTSLEALVGPVRVLAY